MCIQQWNELDLNGNLFQLLKTFIKLATTFILVPPNQTPFYEQKDAPEIPVL